MFSDKTRHAKSSNNHTNVNDNGGSWWLCTSSISAKCIERRLSDGCAASLLYSIVGGILGSHKHSFKNKFCVYIQLSQQLDEDSKMCLNELGEIVPISPINFSDINLEGSNGR